MRALCTEHNLAVAADGKCVLCRRPPGAHLRLKDDRREGLTSRLVTAILGLGLLGAVGSLVWLSTLPDPYSGPRTTASGLGIAGRTRTQAPSQQTAEPAPEAMPAAAVVNDGGAAAAVAAQESDRPSGAAPGPTKEELSAAMAKVQVTLFTTEWCFICDQAQEFLEVRGVRVEPVDVELDDESRKRLLKVNPSGALPAFEIDGKGLAGFNPWELESAVRKAANERL